MVLHVTNSIPPYTVFYPIPPYTVFYPNVAAVRMARLIIIKLCTISVPTVAP